MDSATNDNTLSIRPFVPGTEPAPNGTTTPTVSQATAVAAARQKISQLNRPAYQGSTPTTLSHSKNSTALPYPNPVSPAEENMRHLPQKVKKVSKARTGKLKPILSALATFLFILMLFKAPVLYNQINFLLSDRTAETQITPPTNNAIAETVSPEPLMTIPKINVSAPVVYPTSTANSPNYDPELENGIVHYPNTAVPGQIGNIVLFGHSSNDWWQPGNYKFVFVLLDKLVAGDTFSMNYNSKRYIYQVMNSKVVEATDLSVLTPSSEPIVTLITCWPTGTSLKRLIVTAKQISPSVGNSAPAPTTSTSSTAPILPGSSPTLWQQIGQFWQGVGNGISNKPIQVTSPIE